MTIPTPDVLTQAEQIVSDLLHSHDTEEDVRIIACALTEQARELEKATWAAAIQVLAERPLASGDELLRALRAAAQRAHTTHTEATP